MRVFQFRRTQRKYKATYRVTNWRSYESGLRRRGSVTLWIGRDAARTWCHVGRRRPGGRRVYSDSAIQTFWTIAMVYRLPLRQAEGFLQSVFEMAKLALPVPDHTTVSRGFRRLRRRPMVPRSGGEPIHLVVDTTGLTIHVGKGEPPCERRGWRKIHLAADRETGTVLAQDLSSSSTRDSARVRALLGQISCPLSSISADSAYDRIGVYRRFFGTAKRVGS